MSHSLEDASFRAEVFAACAEGFWNFACRFGGRFPAGGLFRRVDSECFCTFEESAAFAVALPEFLDTHRGE